GNTSIGMREKKNDSSEEDVMPLTELLRYMMYYEPKDRPSVQEVLAHPAMVYCRRS
ncbi:hypothetical protein K458DRAFT_289757, partial [Lentithecium fluviatile CBS 122367]